MPVCGWILEHWALKCLFSEPVYVLNKTNFRQELTYINRTGLTVDKLHCMHRTHIKHSTIVMSKLGGLLTPLSGYVGRDLGVCLRRIPNGTKIQVGTLATGLERYRSVRRRRQMSMSHQYRFFVPTSTRAEQMTGALVR